jgi:hypothetical protein
MGGATSTAAAASVTVSHLAATSATTEATAKEDDNDSDNMEIDPPEEANVTPVRRTKISGTIIKLQLGMFHF